MYGWKNIAEKPTKSLIGQSDAVVQHSLLTKRSEKQQIMLIHHLIKSTDTGSTPDALNLA